MTRRTRILLIAAAAGVIATGVGGAAAIAAGPADHDRPITGPALAPAEAAALTHTGGGRVTETEVGDEDSRYEVEVTLPDGRQVDVQLNEDFTVAGSTADSRPDDTGHENARD